jgi:hypothetical protein
VGISNLNGTADDIGGNSFTFQTPSGLTYEARGEFMPVFHHDEQALAWWELNSNADLQILLCPHHGSVAFRDYLNRIGVDGYIPEEKNYLTK